MPDALTLTDAAAREIVRRMPSPDACLRLGLIKGGCAGMEYRMEVLETSDPADIVIEKDGARLGIAPLAQMFLIGTEVDYRTGLLESGFVFRNPNVSESCGCGESVTFGS